MAFKIGRLSLSTVKIFKILGLESEMLALSLIRYATFGKLIFLSLSFLIFKTRMIVALLQKDVLKIKSNNYANVWTQI